MLESRGPPLSLPPPTPSPRRRVPRRAWLYPLLLVLGACWVGSLRRDPQDDLDALVARLHTCDRDARFQPLSGGAVGVLGARGWTLTLYVGDTSRYAPATFLYLTRIDSVLQGELLADGPADGGGFRQQDLQGAALAEYLARADLDLTALDHVVSTRWGAPEAGK